MIKAAALLCGLLVAASTTSAAEIPLDWAIPASHQPYPTENVNVGDSILFNWMGLHNVYSLNAPVCPAMFSTENSVELAPSAPMGSYVWTAEAPGIYYFACQIGDHCSDGMLISIIVGEGAALTPGAEAPLAPALAPALAPGSAPLSADSEGDEDSD